MDEVNIPHGRSICIAGRALMGAALYNFDIVVILWGDVEKIRLKLIHVITLPDIFPYF